MYYNKEMSNLGWKQITSIVQSIIDLGGSFNQKQQLDLLGTQNNYMPTIELKESNKIIEKEYTLNVIQIFTINRLNPFSLFNWISKG